MIQINKPKGYWTFEKCWEEALKYETKISFRKNCSAAYSKAEKSGFLNKICGHMIQINKPKGYWTFEKCWEEALKYETRKEYSENKSGSYMSAFKNKWLNQICGHMTINHRPNGYWSFEKCRDEALKYQTKKEFEENSPSASVIAGRNGWTEQITSHMTLLGNKYKRCIYSYEFLEDNSVYVGLTYNIDERQRGRDHRNTDQVTKHIKETGYIPNRKILTDYIDVEVASKLEGDFVDKYKNDGWNILNVIKTGGIGCGSLFWNKERCINAASQCKTKSEFNKKFRGAQSSAYKNGWMPEINAILKSNRGGVIKYTIDSCKNKSLLCRTRAEFKKNYICEFNAAYRNGWLDDICKHMINGKLKENRKIWIIGT